MKFSHLVILSLVLMLALAPTALAQETTATSPQTQQEDATTQTWEWPEFGLSLEYPADWQFTLSAESADFVLYGNPGESGNFPFVSMQSGSYDPNVENLNDIFAEIAGEDAEVNETEFGGQPAWQFSYSDEAQTINFIGFGASETQLAMIGFVVPTEQTEEMTPIMDDIIASATLQPLELDTVLLNSQLQVNYDDYGIIGLGNPDAPVKVYEFMDFSCPHCGNFTHSVDRIVQDYVANEDIFLEIVVLDIIGGEASVVASTAQICAIDFGIGWETHELLFYEILFSADDISYTAEDISAVIEEADLGVSADEFAECIANTDITEYSEYTSGLARDLDVTSTPSLLFSNLDTGEIDFIRSSTGEAYRGGLPLLLVYDYIDSLLPEIAE